MAREILFRGKRSDNGEWVQGSYVQDKEWARHGIYQLELRGAFYLLVRHEVAPNTVGQFTGLLDKNGNRVFEGDKVRFESTHKMFMDSKIKRSMNDIGSDALMLVFGFDKYLSVTYKLHFLRGENIITIREYYNYSDDDISRMKDNDKSSLNDHWYEPSRDIDFLRYLSDRDGLTVIGNIHEEREVKNG